MLVMGVESKGWGVGYPSGPLNTPGREATVERFGVFYVCVCMCTSSAAECRLQSYIPGCVWRFDGLRGFLILAFGWKWSEPACSFGCLWPEIDGLLHGTTH